MRCREVAICFIVVLAGATDAFAWGASGHKWLSGMAIEQLANKPDGVPAFVRSPEAANFVAELSVEPDRSRGAGRVHDEERDPGHYIGLDADGTVFGVTPLSNVARTREEFDTTLRSRGISQYRSGYLPYTIVDGWQQVAKDFAYWRALTAVIDWLEVPPKIKEWASADRRNREAITLRDIGVWSHFVGDASMPMHVSRHSDGWGPYDDPQEFTQEKGVHARFESTFVRRVMSRAMVAPKMKPYRACKCEFDIRVSNYLRASLGNVEQLYALEKAGAFTLPPVSPGGAVQPLTPEHEKGIAFASERLAAGASELRDMIEDAWTASLGLGVGYPAVSVKEILAKPALLTPDVLSAD